LVPQLHAADDIRPHEANDKNDHDAADIICQECKSIIATLHGPSAHRPVVRNKRAAKAREMANQEIDRAQSGGDENAR
jgi:hypothetical protein